MATKKRTSKKTATRKRSAKKPVRRTPEPIEEYDNELRGAMFKNKRKTTAKHPDYVGEATIQGIEYWVSSWVNKSKAGKPYFSLAFTEKDADDIEDVEEEIEEDDLPF